MISANFFYPQKFFKIIDEIEYPMPLEKHIQNEDIYTPKLEGLMM
jgi:hypothetical protein